ncbi:MAG: hypothetical protein V3574_03130 [Candidatus Moraniibacteriota bacterium]
MKNREWHEEKIVSIDFDGVLSQYDGWKGEDVTGKPIEGANDFILSLIKSGYQPVVFTTRNPELISNWLNEFGFPDIEVTNTKYPSLVYIDDRCVKFDGDFSKLVDNLKDYDIYWRKKDYKIFDDLKDSKK